MPCPRTQHRNNVSILKGDKHVIYLKILHQAEFETARQAATSTECHALTIVPCPSPWRNRLRDEGAVNKNNTGAGTARHHHTSSRLAGSMPGHLRDMLAQNLSSTMPALPWLAGKSLFTVLNHTWLGFLLWTTRLWATLFGARKQLRFFSLLQ